MALLDAQTGAEDPDALEAGVAALDAPLDPALTPEDRRFKERAARLLAILR